MDQNISACLSSVSGFQKNELLAKYTTFRIGGPADYLVKPKTADEIASVVLCINAHQVPYAILGGGSNTLISDSGYRGVVIVPSLKSIHFKNNSVTVGSGMSLQQCIMKCRDHGLSGLEHLVGIPGTVGGAVAGNAGTSQKWIDAVLNEVEVVSMTDGEVITYLPTECAFGYRTSKFKNNDKEIITQVTMNLILDSIPEITRRIAEQTIKRNSQPGGNACAGCVFKNPPELPAGKIIDELGIKGKRIGKAEVSHVHGNFIVNLGGARAEEIIMLISYIKQQVRDKRGIQLQEEIKYLGF